MAGGGGEPAEGEEYLGAAARDLGKGGGEPSGVGDVFQGGGEGGTTFRVGEVGDDPLHGPGPGGVSTQGSQADHWEAASTVIGRELGVSTFGDCDAGGGVLSF